MTARKKPALDAATLRVIANSCLRSSRDYTAAAKQDCETMLALPPRARGRKRLDYSERVNWARAFVLGDLGRALRANARDIERAKKASKR